jgi:hypothetical protein
VNQRGLGAYSYDVEVPHYDPQGMDVEGAVCASLWDILDPQNDRDTLMGETMYHNADWNGGLWWQEIDEIWHVLCEPGDLGHFPRTICEFQHIWGWKGYPVDFDFCSIFFGHGIGIEDCPACNAVSVPYEVAVPSTVGPFLWSSCPNPFNPATEIAFRVGWTGPVSLEIFNTAGQLVRTLVRSRKEPGTYTVWWDGKDDSGGKLASGVYFCQFVVGVFMQTRKLVILR